MDNGATGGVAPKINAETQKRRNAERSNDMENENETGSGTTEMVEPTAMETANAKLADKEHPHIFWGGAGVAPEIIEVTYNGQPIQVYCKSPDAEQLAEHDSMCTVIKGKKKSFKMKRVEANLAITPQCIVGIQENALGYCDEHDEKFVIGSDMDGGLKRMRECLVKGHPILVNTIANKLFLTGAYIEEVDDPLDDGADK